MSLKHFLFEKISSLHFPFAINCFFRYLHFFTSHIEVEVISFIVVRQGCGTGHCHKNMENVSINWSQHHPVRCTSFQPYLVFKFLHPWIWSLMTSRIHLLCAASQIWVRNRSMVIVPPEEDLEFRCDSEKSWCFIHVTIKAFSGTTQRSVFESCITHVSSSPRETWKLSPRGLRLRQGDAKSENPILRLRSL